MLTDERISAAWIERPSTYDDDLELQLRYFARAIEAEVLQAQEPAKAKFDRLMGDENETPIERLRFFCSLAMSGQDWLDVEPFFDALTAPQPPVPCPICADKDWYGIDALQAKVAVLEQLIMKYQAAATPSERLVLRLRSKITEQSAEIERLEKYEALDEQRNRDFETIAQQAERIAELEKVAKAYEDQVAAHNKTLDEVARLSAMIEKCEKALEDVPDEWRHSGFGEALAALAAQKGGAA